MSQPDPLELHINTARRFRDRPTLSHSTVLEILPDSDPRTERARQMAALNIMRDPEVRKLLLDTYGLAYCQTRYPEAFRPSTDRVSLARRIRQLFGGN